MLNTYQHPYTHFRKDRRTSWTGSCLFLLAGLFGDVLLIRLCLSLAFLCLIAGSLYVTGTTGTVAVDSLLWCALTGLLHWYASWRLLREELRSTSFADENDQALFNYLHRRTGLTAQDFFRLRAVGEWKLYGAGELICDTESARRQLFILVEGKVRARLLPSDTARVLSG